LIYSKILFIGLLSLLLSSQLYAARKQVNNIHFQYAADHMWLFYECGGNLYFNHELRDSRREGTSSIAFSWRGFSTLFGMKYCNGYGFSFTRELINKNSKVQSTNNGNNISVYFKSQSQSQYIKYKSYIGRPKSTPENTKWSGAKYVTDQLGKKITASQYSVAEFSGSTYIAFQKENKAYIRNANGKVFQVRDLNLNSNSPTFSLVTTVDKTGSNLILLTTSLSHQSEKVFQLTKINLLDLSKGQLSFETITPKLFFNGNSSKSIRDISLKAELSGQLSIQYVNQSKRYKSILDIKTLEPAQYLPNDNFTSPFTSKESLAYDMVQIPIGCKINIGCDLINFNYPKASNWLAGISKLFHLSYAGKVVIEPIHTIPIELEQLELIGIIEGPPPVPLENILSSFAALPQDFVLNAARGLSKLIKTNINQVMTMVHTQSKEEAKTRVHSVSMNASIPFISPVKLSGMASVKSKVIENISTTKTTVIKKTYSNEIQHASDQDNKIFMKPVGKLIFLKYDITGHQYKFLNSNNKVIEHGPSLYSLSKTNIRPVVRQYDMIARKLYPHKYQNSFTIGDLYSYKNFHRRRMLLEKATPLAPGNDYLSFTYNNALDLSSEIDIKTSSTVKRSSTDTFKTEGSVGLGFGDIFGAEVSISNEEERTISVANSTEKGMGIGVQMNFVVPTEDASVKFYDFEVYYLEPSATNLNDLTEELKDTASKSLWNRKMLKSIKANSKPWKITYSVSNIIENENLPIDDKDDIYGEGQNIAYIKKDLPKTFFSLSQRCEDLTFASDYEKACQYANSYMKNQK
jgi:hypothetical protein